MTPEQRARETIDAMLTASDWIVQTKDKINLAASRGVAITELYNVQHFASNKLDPVARVCITTIQRLDSMLKGEAELPEDMDEKSGFEIADALYREHVPKTLIYAKDDSHADDIVEIVLFMRSVRSRTFFEQMKGRGVRVISETELQAVTPDAKNKTHFVIVDAVGVCERDKTDSRPLERKRSVPFEKLLEAIALGNRQEDVVSSLAGRLARLERQLDKTEHGEVQQLSGGKPLAQLTAALVDALNPDRAVEAAKAATALAYGERTAAQVEQAGAKLVHDAIAPLANNPPLRNKLIALQKAKEQTIDTVSQDQVIAAGFDAAAKEKAAALMKSFRDHIATSLSIEPDDFDYAPFSQRGGLGKAHQLFGEELPELLEELNMVLAA